MADWRMKVSVLWVFVAVSFSALTMIALLMPGGIEQLIAGESEEFGAITEGVLLFFAIFWLIPLTMAFLSLTLKDSANRWANIIVAIVWAALGIYDIGDGLKRGWLTVSLISFSKTVASALIIWYAWKSKQKA